VATVEEVMRTHASDPSVRVAQRRLADEVTALIHGDEAARLAGVAGNVLFGGGEVDAEAMTAIRGIVPETELDARVLEADEPLVDLLLATALATSRRDARQTIDGGGLTVNGARVEPGERGGIAPIGDGFILLQKGRRTRHLVVIRTP
jgi:tyrosyl-tRNA synthetase